MSGATVRRVALVAWAFQALIVLSGAAVRLTQAGLGCEDWPTCNDNRLTPEWELHGWIEFGNRLVSLVVVLSTIAAVVAARRRVPLRPELVRFAWLLVAGTAAQVVLGGITVLADLNPIVVSGHFLLSMVLLWAAQSLWLLAGPQPPTPPPTDGRTATLTRAQLIMAGIVLLLGTGVTGTGPNSGDGSAERLGFELTTVARTHAVSVWLLVALVVLLALHLVRAAPGEVAAIGLTPVRFLLTAIVAQGVLGYTQYWLGVPPALVEVHVLGAVIVWSLSLYAYQRLLGVWTGLEATTEPAADDTPARGHPQRTA